MYPKELLLSEKPTAPQYQLAVNWQGWRFFYRRPKGVIWRSARAALSCGCASNAKKTFESQKP
ncbi:MAG: hypothetical protein CM15mP120_15130 [Pseudomonadota bacterium]|nr:MAG: hypothetical protein CM15mP120_15130 [Pseudomonadota bacterium]